MPPKGKMAVVEPEAENTTYPQQYGFKPYETSSIVNTNKSLLSLPSLTGGNDQSASDNTSHEETEAVYGFSPRMHAQAQGVPLGYQPGLQIYFYSPNQYNQIQTTSRMDHTIHPPQTVQANEFDLGLSNNQSNVMPYGMYDSANAVGFDDEHNLASKYPGSITPGLSQPQSSEDDFNPGHFTTSTAWLPLSPGCHQAPEQGFNSLTKVPSVFLSQSSSLQDTNLENSLGSGNITDSLLSYPFINLYQNPLEQYNNDLAQQIPQFTHQPEQENNDLAQDPPISQSQSNKRKRKAIDADQGRSVTKKTKLQTPTTTHAPIKPEPGTVETDQPGEEATITLQVPNPRRVKPQKIRAKIAAGHLLNPVLPAFQSLPVNLRHIDGFPPYHDPLPAGLTLFDVCAHYPNHVSVPQMTYWFWEAKWKARDIEMALTQECHDQLRSNQPWARFQKRLGAVERAGREDQGLFVSLFGRTDDDEDQGQGKGSNGKDGGNKGGNNGGSNRGNNGGKGKKVKNNKPVLRRSARKAIARHSV